MPCEIKSEMQILTLFSSGDYVQGVPESCHQLPRVGHPQEQFLQESRGQDRRVAVCLELGKAALIIVNFIHRPSVTVMVTPVPLCRRSGQPWFLQWSSSGHCANRISTRMSWVRCDVMSVPNEPDQLRSPIHDPRSSRSFDLACRCWSVGIT